MRHLLIASLCLTTIGTPAVVSAQSAPTSNELARTIAVANARASFERVQANRPNVLDAIEHISRRDAAEPESGVWDRSRMQRARRLTRMANSGQCPEAIRTAWDEGDRAMAERLYDACRNDRVPVS